MNRGRNLVLSEYFHHSCWGANPDDASEISKQKIRFEKCFILIIWGRTGIKSLLYVPKGMKYHMAFFVESVVPDLVEHVCQKTLRGIMVHLDNAWPHNSSKSEAALPAIKSRRIPAPGYSSDLSPSDFFLFGMLNERMSRTLSSPRDELISAISEPIASFQKDQLASVDKNWMERLNWVMKHEEEYDHK
jgi:hypothetical protein